MSHYAAVFTEIGIGVPASPAIPLGLLFAIALAALSIGGTENTAKLQKKGYPD